MPAGRPTKYTPAIAKKARDYNENYQEKYGDVIPSIVGMADALELSRSTLYLWAEDKEHEFSDILERCNVKQEKILINKGLIGDFQSSMAKLLLVKHGYHDKQETALTGPGGQPLLPKTLTVTPVAAKPSDS